MTLLITPVWWCNIPEATFLQTDLTFVGPGCWGISFVSRRSSFGRTRSLPFPILEYWERNANPEKKEEFVLAHPWWAERRTPSPRWAFDRWHRPQFSWICLWLPARGHASSLSDCFLTDKTRVFAFFGGSHMRAHWAQALDISPKVREQKPQL